MYSYKRIQLFLYRARKSALAYSSSFHRPLDVPWYSNGQTPAATFSSSAMNRISEQSLQGNASNPSAVIHPTLKPVPLNVVAAKGTTVVFSNGKTMEDTTCGAAVSCIGYHNERVKSAMLQQIDNFSYSNSMFYGHQIGEELAAELISGTKGKMAKVYMMCSGGAEAMEAAMKMARQYYTELNPKQPQRTNFIGREGSYHGSTLGSLSMGGHIGRRKIFEGMLLDNVHRVSAANEYRGKADGQTTEEYVQQLADELDRKFQELGPDTVAAFVCESLVGATLGTVPAPVGYFRAMKRVCDRHGALLILDEVMSGMGRCGSLHEWEQEDVIPDIQTIAKGLAGGFAPMAGMLINHRVSDALMAGTGIFSHAHTYQGHPVGCAAALEVQRIVREDSLVDNVRKNGEYLGRLLHEQLDDHPHIGDVRGISLYPGMGTKDGLTGDHVWIAPAYTTTKSDVERIVSKVKESVVLALG
ncbi:hypothetical protein FGRMN_7549 [Fusarium graminum]|nr:hypothetical protein FGRMN_7549 [Fusarium graminum]